MIKLFYFNILYLLLLILLKNSKIRDNYKWVMMIRKNVMFYDGMKFILFLKFGNLLLIL